VRKREASDWAGSGVSQRIGFVAAVRRWRRLASMRFTMMAARKKKPNGITTKTITEAAVFI